MGRPEDMKEIRFCWSIIRRYSISDIPIQGGLWHPDTPDNQRDLEIVIETGMSSTAKERTGLTSAGCVFFTSRMNFLLNSVVFFNS